MTDKFEALSRQNFEKWLAGDYSPDRSSEATSAGEDAFKSVMWHIYSSAQLPLLAALEEKDQRITELWQRLMKPVKLPERLAWKPNERAVLIESEVIEAIRSTGFQFEVNGE